MRGVENKPVHVGGRGIPVERVSAFCKQWRITEPALFSSVLREDFGPDSDVDVLVTIEPGFHPGIDECIEMRSELEAMFQRSVDLVNKRYLRNPYVRHSNLTTRHVLHAA